jgi:hypothetical protein
MGEKRNAYRILGGKARRKERVGDSITTLIMLNFTGTPLY